MPEKGWLNELMVVKGDGDSIKTSLVQVAIAWLILMAAMLFFLFYYFGVEPITSAISYLKRLPITVHNFVVIISVWFLLLYTFTAVTIIMIYALLLFILVWFKKLIVYMILSIIENNIIAFYKALIQYKKVVKVNLLENKLVKLYSIVVIVAAVISSVCSLYYDINIKSILVGSLVSIIPLYAILIWIIHRHVIDNIRKSKNVRLYYIVNLTRMAGMKFFISLCYWVLLFILFSVTFLPIIEIVMEKTVGVTTAIVRATISSDVKMTRADLSKKDIEKLINSSIERLAGTCTHSDIVDELKNNKYFIGFIYNVIVVFVVILILWETIKRYIMLKRHRASIWKKTKPALISFVFSAAISLTEKYIFEGQNMPFWFGLSFTSSFLFLNSLNALGKIPKLRDPEVCAERKEEPKPLPAN